MRDFVESKHTVFNFVFFFFKLKTNEKRLRETTFQNKMCKLMFDDESDKREINLI